MRSILFLLALTACQKSTAECDAAKDAARKAWGEVSVRYGVARATAESEAEESAGRLAALERHKDAPQTGKEVLEAEVKQRQAAIDAALAPEGRAKDIRDAFANATADEGQARAEEFGTKYQGKDITEALAKGRDAQRMCAGTGK